MINIPISKYGSLVIDQTIRPGVGRSKGTFFMRFKIMFKDIFEQKSLGNLLSFTLKAKDNTKTHFYLRILIY